MRKAVAFTLAVAVLMTGFTRVVTLAARQAPAMVNTQDAAFARVEKSATLRCGYAVYPPFLIKDKEGKFSGVFYELTEMVADILGWKVEWAVQVPYPSPANVKALDDLESGKFDMLCAGVHWFSPWESKRMWSTPTMLFYSGFGLYVRDNDKRFPTGFDVRKLNDPQYKMVLNPGVGVDRLRKTDFPTAGVVPIKGYNDMVKELGDGKGDFAVIELEVANNYMTANPGKIRNLVPDKPVRAYGLSFQVAYGENRLRNVVDAAVSELLWGGTVDNVLDKYEKVPTFYRVAMPYSRLGPKK